MIRLKRIIVCILMTSLAWFHAPASLAQDGLPEGICQVDGVMTVPVFHEHIACLAGTMSDVIWPENILPGIRNSGLSDNGLDRQIKLSFPKGCSFIPRYELGSDVIKFPYVLLYTQRYYAQAVLAYLLKFPFVSSPRELRGFLDDTLSGHLRNLRRQCPNSDYAKTGFVSPIPPSVFAGQITDQERNAWIKKAQTYAPLRKLEAFTANSSIFFAIIHEHAHAILHNDPKSANSFTLEREADAYAAKAMRSNKLSVILSLGLFDMLHSVSRSAHSKELSCRVAELAESNRVSNQFAIEFGQDAKSQLELLRRYYITFYKDRCTN